MIHFKIIKFKGNGWELSDRINILHTPNCHWDLSIEGDVKHGARGEDRKISNKSHVN